MGANYDLLAPLPYCQQRLIALVFLFSPIWLKVFADIVMMLRLQTERMEGREIPSQHEYFKLFGLNAEKLAATHQTRSLCTCYPYEQRRRDRLVIADDHKRSLITTQVEMGVATRMACLEAVSLSAQAQEAK